MLMHLVRDILDAELLDKHERHIGRVDGIVLELRQGRPPRVVAMEIGADTWAARVHPRLAAWLRRLTRAGWAPLETVRVSMHQIRDIGVDIELDVDGERDPQLRRGEKWLRGVVGRIPGGGA